MSTDTNGVPAISEPGQTPDTTLSAVTRVLRSREVCARTGLSRTTIWRLTRSGEFPAQRRLSANAVGWIEAEVEEWINSRDVCR